MNIHRLSEKAVRYSSGMDGDREYYRGIIDNIGEYGGYFYLGEGVCMPHAKPETGVFPRDCAS